MMSKLTYCRSLIRVCLLLVTVVLLPTVSQAVPFEEMIGKVQREMNIEGTEGYAMAEKFINYVQDAVEQIQENFSKIASHQTPRKEKDELIKATIEKYFDGNSATVQVRTLDNPKKIKSFSVETYLNRLSRLSESQYDTVSLLFDQDYLSMGKIEKDSKNSTYEFKVDMWQMFEGCRRDEPSCYKDYTEKGLHFVFKPVAGSWKLKVKLITAQQPIPFREGVWQ